MNKYDTMQNFVTAEAVAIERPRTDLIRRSDVIGAVNGVIDLYGQQQRAALTAIQDETMQGRGFLSDGAQIAERRKTSRMYLVHQVCVTGMVAAGIVGIAYLAGVVGSGGAFVGWLAMTGGIALVLGWLMHRHEMTLTPENIALRLIDAHENVQLYGLETQRITFELEHQSEAARRAQAAQEAERARAMALDAERRRAAQRAANERQQRDFWANFQDAPERAQTPVADQTHVDAPIVESSPSERAQTGIHAPTWREGLAEWIISLYVTDGAISESGTVKVRAPWSARSPWSDSDKAEMKRVALGRYPALFETSGNGNLRLLVEKFPNADHAMAIISPRLAD